MRGLRTILALAAALVLGVLLFRGRSAREERGAGAADADDVPLAAARLAKSGDETVIRLDTAEVRRAGIVTASLVAVQAVPTADVLGEIAADPGAVVVIRAPITGRLVASRWPAVGERVAAGVELAQVGDARPLVPEAGGVVTGIGARPGAVVQAGQELLTLQTGGATLARLVWTEPGSPPERVELATLGEPGRRVRATFAGLAPDADPATRRPVALYRLGAGLPGAGVGTPVVARVAVGEAVRGVRVPTSATVQWEGLVWAFVERAPGDFARVRVPTDLPLPDGWAVREGLAPGDLVVTRGAEQLLSEEFRAEARVGEEVGE